jgi:5-methylcytosine-specific restriction endonuclease McrA
MAASFATRYRKRMEAKYLVSGPAPIGRILNYVRRVQNRQYTTSYRGPIRRDNLDNWTICLMVGLGLINPPVWTPYLQITLTSKGKRMYNLIRNFPNFPDNPLKSRINMLSIKNQLKNQNLRLYNSLKNMFLNSDAMQNLLVFLRHENAENIEKEEFKKFGRIFGVNHAWFNRVPSLLQIAEFCDILHDEGNSVRIVSGVPITTRREVIEQDLREAKRRQGESGEIDLEEQDLLADLSRDISLRKKRVVIEQIQRHTKIAKRLKALYHNECQICRFTFAKKNGELYSESHHIIPLGRKGSDRIDNIIILCPNCHRQLHYANIKYGKKRANRMFLRISNVKKYVNYHPTHFQALQEADLQ